MADHGRRNPQKAELSGRGNPQREGTPQPGRGTPIEEPPDLRSQTGPSPDISGIGDDYINRVAHELRASLNTIFGWAELLRTRSFDEAGRIRAAETILRHSHQQLWLINELMDTWRLMSGTLRLSVGPVDLSDLVRSAAQAIEPVAAAKHINIHLDLAPLSGQVQGDATRLKQAVVALLANAVHFMTAPGTIEVRLVPSPAGAELTCHDEGLGIPEEARAHLFDRQRPTELAQASRRGDIGLGLSLVRDVIDLHGGSIIVESEGQHGVTFRLSLPLESAPSAVRLDPTWIPHRGPGEHPMRSRLVGLTVLLVDDEADAREVVAGILKHYGASVVPTSSVADALARLKQERIDVLLTDIAMPGQDGYDLIRRVRKLGVPVAALTAFASEEDRRRALEAGFQVYLSKPVDPHVLIETIEALGRGPNA
jgi:CheY-like chemotaxis protein/two-component sensor histidine kinase